MTLNPNHIHELLDQATPGPWEWWGNDLDGPMGSVLDIEVECGAFCNGGMAKLDATPNLEYDQQLIALAPELARDWLRMRHALKEMREIVKDDQAIFGKWDTMDAHSRLRWEIQQIHNILNGETNE